MVEDEVVVRSAELVGSVEGVLKAVARVRRWVVMVWGGVDTWEVSIWDIPWEMREGERFTHFFEVLNLVRMCQCFMWKSVFLKLVEMLRIAIVRSAKWREGGGGGYIGWKTIHDENNVDFGSLGVEKYIVLVVEGRGGIC